MATVILEAHDDQEWAFMGQPMLSYNNAQLHRSFDWNIRCLMATLVTHFVNFMLYAGTVLAN